MRRRTEDDLSLRSALRGLPQREPPAALWGRIEAALAEHDADNVSAQAPAAPLGAASIRYALAAGVAAVALLAAFVLTGHLRTSDSLEPVQRVVDAPETTVVTDDLTRDDLGDFAELLAESARLERALVAMPRHEGVIRVGTAGTIAGLEDHIAWIDAELSASAALEFDPSYQEGLWRDRVLVMNALVDVHYAQLPVRVLLP
jgi:hypothetical protein